MIAGRLNARITLQRGVTVSDGGAATTTYSTTASRVPADVQTATASRVERLFGSRVTEVTSYVITVRSGFDIDMQDRLVWHQTATQDVTMEVVGIALTGPRKDVTVLLAESRS